MCAGLCFKIRPIARWLISFCLLIVVAAPALADRIPYETYEKIQAIPGENLISNGDFSLPRDNDLPAEWGSVEFWSNETKVNIRRAFDPKGNAALHVKFLTDGGCVINYLLREKSRYIAIDEKVYLFHSMRVRHQGRGVIYGQTIDTNYQHIGKTNNIDMNSDWVETGNVYLYDPLVHHGIAMVRIYIKDAKAGDEYWIDDYNLQTIALSDVYQYRENIAKINQWSIIREADIEANSITQKRNLLMDSSFESNPQYCRLRDGMKWWTVGGDIITGDAVHGDYAVRDNVRSDPYNYRKEQIHTISAHIKGPVKTESQVKVSDPHNGGHIEKKFTIDETWRRYAFSFKTGGSREEMMAFLCGTRCPAWMRYVDPEVSYKALVIEIEGKGCLIDAVKLEEGGLSDYHPQEVELFVLVKRYENRSHVSYFYEDEKIPLLITAQKEGNANLHGDIVVRDFWMKEISRIPWQVSIKERQWTGRQEIYLQPLSKGAYRVHVETKGSKSRSMQFGVLSRELAKGSEICGGSHATGLKHNRDFVKAMGVTWSRHHAGYSGLYYGRSEKVPWLGSGYWQDEDRQLAEKAWNLLLRHWGSFYYPPEPYRSMLTKLAGTDQTLPEDFFTNTRAYFKAALPRFKEQVRYWECWNEPTDFSPKQYLQMLKHFYGLIKKLDPNAVVVGFSGFLDRDTWNRYMVPLMEMGALQYCDVLSYHGYWNEWPEDKLFGYQTLRSFLDRIKREAIHVGKPDMPIWDNEFTLWGTSWYDDERTLARLRPPSQMPFDYRTGAAVIVHYITIAYAHGVRHFGPHCFDHDQAVKDEGPREYDQRAFEYDYGIKPKTLAYAVVSNKLEKARFVDEYIHDDFHAYVFDKPHGSMAVLFMRQGKKANAKIMGKNLTFKNIFDGPFSGVKKVRQGIHVELIGEPVYVESPLAGWQLMQIMKTIAID